LLSPFIEPSKKAIGRFEKPLIQLVSQFFDQLGYKCYPHASLNLAWANILSDIDVLLVKDNALTVVEVKSKRDNLRKGRHQLLGIADYVDYAFVATDKRVRDWDDKEIGLILIEDGKPRIATEAKRFVSRPGMKSLFGLQKKCLVRMTGRKSSYESKCDVAEETSLLGDDDTLKQCVKEIVICGRRCETDCPIWEYSFISHVPPSRNFLPEFSA
jgi:hypothetical protein